MPDASATKPAFGITAKIFLASTLLVVAVLGITFGVTSIQANRTADASIHRALLSTRRAVDDYLAARTRTLGRASTVATDVPQYRERLLDQRARAEALDQADDIRGLIGAAWVLVTNSEGILIARTDYREQYDRDLSIAPLVANALSGEQTSGAWLDDVRGAMFMAVGTPLRWQLPKGLLTPDEDPETAALREVREETGIASRLRAPLEKIEYWYYGQNRGQRVRFHKVVHFFLFEFVSGNTADHDHEVEEARWMEIGQAQKLLAFKNEQKVVNQALTMLEGELT